jgi:hypothetical protein
MKWKELDAKAQRKALILAAFVVIALLALLWPVSQPRPRIVPRRPPPPAGPQNLQRMPQAQPRPQSVILPPAKDAGMLGRWQSGVLHLPKRGTCILWLEVSRQPQEADKYTGAATLNCQPVIDPPHPRREALLSRFRVKPPPVAATLSGAWQKDAIALKAEKLLNGGDCGLTGLNVSRFGSLYLAVEFQDGCGGAQALMRKAR